MRPIESADWVGKRRYFSSRATTTTRLEESWTSPPPSRRRTTPCRSGSWKRTGPCWRHGTETTQRLRHGQRMRWPRSTPVTRSASKRTSADGWARCPDGEAMSPSSVACSSKRGTCTGQGPRAAGRGDRVAVVRDDRL